MEFTVTVKKAYHVSLSESGAEEWFYSIEEDENIPLNAENFLKMLNKEAESDKVWFVYDIEDTSYRSEILELDISLD